MKRMLTRLAFFLMLFVLLIACNDEGKIASSSTEEIKPGFDIAGARKAIETINADYAMLYAKGDSVALANHYASDAKAMIANIPAAVGRAAIQTLFDKQFKMMGPASLEITTTGVWGTEEMLGEEGTIVITDDEGKQIDRGKYIVLWKMEDGKWKIFRDCYNSDLPHPN